MLRNIIRMAVAGAVVLLVAGCATESSPMAQNTSPRLGAGDTVGKALYTPVSGMFATRSQTPGVGLAGVRQDE